MSAENPSEKRTDIEPLVVTGENATCIQELAERFNMSEEDVAEGVLDVGRLLISAMEQGFDIGLITYNRRGQHTLDSIVNFESVAVECRQLVPFALTQRSIKNRRR